MDNENKKSIEDMVSEIRSIKESLEAEKRSIEQERSAHSKRTLLTGNLKLHLRGEMLLLL